MELPLFIMGCVLGLVVPKLVQHALLLGIWRRAYYCGVKVSLIQLVLSKMRGNPTKTIVEALITLRHRGFRELKYSQLEIFYLANQFDVQGEASLVAVYEKANADGR